MSKDSKELFGALEQLEAEKHIPVSYMLEKIEAALLSAFKKEYNNESVRIVLDPEKKEFKVFSRKEIVETVTDPKIQISLAEAKTIKKSYSLGQFVETEVKTQAFRRLSATAAKSVIIQGLREGERMVMQEAYESTKNKIITATVSKIDKETGAVIVETGTSLATLMKNDQIPGETFAVGDQVKVYVSEVNSDTRGPLVRISRVTPGFIARLFELQVPEIADGTIKIQSIAREPGSRAKMAVSTEENNVDPIGSCIGLHGSRINAIVDELRGEKIDIVKYSDDMEDYIKAALSPASILSVKMIEPRSYRVVVEPDQLSLAIGREGQNARLAARLTGCKIDIKTEF